MKNFFKALSLLLGGLFFSTIYGMQRNDNYDQAPESIIKFIHENIETIKCREIRKLIHKNKNVINYVDNNKNSLLFFKAKGLTNPEIVEIVKHLVQKCGASVSLKNQYDNYAIDILSLNLIWHMRECQDKKYRKAAVDAAIEDYDDKFREYANYIKESEKLSKLLVIMNKDLDLYIQRAAKIAQIYLACDPTLAKNIFIPWKGGNFLGSRYQEKARYYVNVFLDYLSIDDLFVSIDDLNRLIKRMRSNYVDDKLIQDSLDILEKLVDHKIQFKDLKTISDDLLAKVFWNIHLAEIKESN